MAEAGGDSEQDTGDTGDTGEALLARLLHDGSLVSPGGGDEGVNAAVSDVERLVTVVGAGQRRDLPKKIEPPTELLARVAELLPKMREANERLGPSGVHGASGAGVLTPPPPLSGGQVLSNNEMPEEIVELFDLEEQGHGGQHVEMDVFIDDSCGELARDGEQEEPRKQLVMEIDEDEKTSPPPLPSEREGTDHDDEVTTFEVAMTETPDIGS